MLPSAAASFCVSERLVITSRLHGVLAKDNQKWTKVNPLSPLNFWEMLHFCVALGQLCFNFYHIHFYLKATISSKVYETKITAEEFGIFTLRA
jgi:hypothetical protein